MRTKLAILSGLFLSSVCEFGSAACSLPETDLYVSWESGSDSYAGSEDYPFLTINAALNKAALTSATTPNIHIKIQGATPAGQGGTYGTGPNGLVPTLPQTKYRAGHMGVYAHNVHGTADCPIVIEKQENTGPVTVLGGYEYPKTTNYTSEMGNNQQLIYSVPLPAGIATRDPTGKVDPETLNSFWDVDDAQLFLGPSYTAALLHGGSGCGTISHTICPNGEQSNCTGYPDPKDLVPGQAVVTSDGVLHFRPYGDVSPQGKTFALSWDDAIALVSSSHTKWINIDTKYGHAGYAVFNDSDPSPPGLYSSNPYQFCPKAGCSNFNTLTGGDISYARQGVQEEPTNYFNDPDLPTAFLPDYNYNPKDTASQNNSRVETEGVPYSFFLFDASDASANVSGCHDKNGKTTYNNQFANLKIHVIGMFDSFEHGMYIKGICSYVFNNQISEYAAAGIQLAGGSAVSVIGNTITNATVDKCGNVTPMRVAYGQMDFFSPSNIGTYWLPVSPNSPPHTQALCSDTQSPLPTPTCSNFVGEGALAGSFFYTATQSTSYSSCFSDPNYNNPVQRGTVFVGIYDGITWAVISRNKITTSGDGIQVQQPQANLSGNSIAIYLPHYDPNSITKPQSKCPATPPGAPPVQPLSQTSFWANQPIHGINVTIDPNSASSLPNAMTSKLNTIDFTNSRPLTTYKNRLLSTTPVNYFLFWDYSGGELPTFANIDNDAFDGAIRAPAVWGFGAPGKPTYSTTLPQAQAQMISISGQNLSTPCQGYECNGRSDK